jgi:hypothetical protein
MKEKMEEMIASEMNISNKVILESYLYPIIVKNKRCATKFEKCMKEYNLSILRNNNNNNNNKLSINELDMK